MVSEKGFLKIEDEAFWDSLSEEKVSAINRHMNESGFSGLLIDAPCKVDRREHSTIDIIGFRMDVAYEICNFSLKYGMLVYTVDYETGNFLCNNAFYFNQLPEYKDIRPASELAKGGSGGFFSFDPTARLPSFTLKPGEIEVRTLLFSKMSNNRVIRIIDGDKPLKLKKVPVEGPAFENLSWVNFFENGLASGTIALKLIPDTFKAVVEHGETFDECIPVTPVMLEIKFNCSSAQIYELLTPRTKIKADIIAQQPVTRIIRFNIVLTGRYYSKPVIFPLDIPLLCEPDTNGNIQGTVNVTLEKNLPTEDELYAVWVIGNRIISNSEVVRVVSKANHERHETHEKRKLKLKYKK
jgi:hypothetical protein